MAGKTGRAAVGDQADARDATSANADDAAPGKPAARYCRIPPAPRRPGVLDNPAFLRSDCQIVCTGSNARASYPGRVRAAGDDSDASADLRLVCNPVVAAFVVPAPTAKGAPVTWTLAGAPDPSSSPIPIASGPWTYDLVVKDPSGIASSLGAQDLVAGSVVAAAPPAVAIMEPSTFGVVIGALGGLALIRARRRGHT